MKSAQLPGFGNQNSKRHPEASNLAQIRFYKDAALGLFVKRGAMINCEHLRHLHAFMSFLMILATLILVLSGTLPVSTSFFTHFPIGGMPGALLKWRNFRMFQNLLRAAEHNTQHAARFQDTVHSD